MKDWRGCWVAAELAQGISGRQDRLKRNRVRQTPVVVIGTSAGSEHYSQQYRRKGAQPQGEDRRVVVSQENLHREPIPGEPTGIRATLD